MSTLPIKEEIVDPTDNLDIPTNSTTAMMIPVSSSNVFFGSCFDYSDDDMEGISPLKKMRAEAALPVGFVDPLPPEERAAWQQSRINAGKASSIGFIAPLRSVRPKAEYRDVPFSRNDQLVVVAGEKQVVAPANIPSCKQFWKAGDYEGIDGGFSAVGMDHVRVHPKFLHSNATSHKWALGAFAELLDNAMDEVCNGATYVSVDVLDNKKEKGKMLLVEDNGGGMTPDKMRQCMSLGYSAKSKLANTIGQYGNGFKTSSMRLGADVIVFSRCQGRDGTSTTQSVGMLSYTFLRSTGKEDIVVPMIDFVKREETWEMLTRSSVDDWKRNSETIVQWSAYESEEDLFQQFELLNDQGTRIIIYNLWEDEEGATELDFDTDPQDIQIRGVSRDEKKIEMAKQYPNSRHFLTYQHSLRSYASILYLRLAPGFRIILRGKDVEHHNLVNDMMLSEEITYRPQPVGDETSKDPNAVAVVTIGFVKDAEHHIDIQGFNVYHKNRLIKPFWRVWNAAGSDGRGAIGVLEANFVEPAHDKQGFERTIVLARLEARLQAMQKKYWSSNCHLIGYAKRRNVKNSVSPEKETNTCANSKSCSRFSSNGHTTYNDKSKSKSTGGEHEKGPVHSSTQARNQTMSGETQQARLSNKQTAQTPGISVVKVEDTVSNLREENQSTKNSLQQVLRDLQYERDRNRTLEGKLKAAEKRISDLDNNHDNLALMLIEERRHWQQEEESLRCRLKDASVTIDGLLKKVKVLESRITFSCKTER
uniref:Protein MICRORCHIDIA 7-like n=1 Tax=Nicotiana tabacum TaxID=4097 RepID=A0A1S4B716_TOBAC|nr:PREDICTED: protein MICRORCHIDIA 7-like [Nicotiana tabacum]